MRVDKEITGEERDEILSWVPHDICVSLLRNLFTSQDPGIEPKYMTNDYFLLPKEKFKTTKDGYTTIGIYICNLHLIQPNFSELFGYLNQPFDGKLVSMIEGKLSTALLNDHITTDSMADYYNRIQWLGGNNAMQLIMPSVTSALLKPAPGLKELKAKLMEENKEAIANGDPIVASKIEQELIKYATKYLEKDEGFENFASNAKADISNNYKTMQIMKGAVINTLDGKYRVNSSECNDGVKKEEYASMADSQVLGSYSRAVATGEGGYMAKKFNQTLNSAAAAPKGSDCGTKRFLKVIIYPEAVASYVNRYIKGPDGKLLKLTSDNIKQYENREVEMRSPMFCEMEDPKYCNMCLGDQPYMMNLINFGLAISKLPNVLLQNQMKKFHDLSVKTTDIDITSVFKFKE